MNGHASGSTVVAVTVTFTVLAATFVACRTYARLGIARNPGSDDVAIVFAMVFALGTTITMLFQVKYGMGRRQASLSRDEGVSLMQAFYVSVWMYNLSLCSTKIAILLQYLRVFSVMKTFRKCCYVLLTIVVVYMIYATSTAIFACRPIAFFWDESIPGGTCLPRFPIWFANAGTNIATDMATAILPMPVLKNLELPKRTKRALMTVFLLGGFTCVVSVLRLQSLYVISQAKDVSWNNPMAAVWSNIEINTAIMCSCLPTLRCLFPHIFKSRISQPRSGNSGGDYRNEDRGFKQKLVGLFTAKRSERLHSHGSLEAGGLEVKPSFPLREFRSRDNDHRQSRIVTGSGGNSRGSRGSQVVSDGILVSKAIDQEVEIREDLGDDDKSTRDMVGKH